MSQLARQIDTDNIPLTVESMKAVMPKRQKHNINQSLVDEMNSLVTDPEARNVFRENLLGYTSVLGDPNIRLPTYIEAVKYMSYVLMGNTNQESWIKTFPARYKRLLGDKKDSNFIRATVACYNRNKVVASIRELSMIPSWLLNQDTYQQAINVQVRLMVGAKSETVRQNAADSLMTHLKQPEVTKVSLDVNVVEDDSIRELRQVTTDLVKAQRKAIEAGTATAKEVAESTIISADYKRIEK